MLILIINILLENTFLYNSTFSNIVHIFIIHKSIYSFNKIRSQLNVTIIRIEIMNI